MTHPVFVALDVESKAEVDDLLAKLGDPQDVAIKIGMEVYYHFGPDLVKNLANKGYQIFLDLKLHDIPNTVYRASKQIASLGVYCTTVHALGGSQMLAAAKKGLIEGAGSNAVPKLLAVTELTSISDDVLKNEQNCKLAMKDQVASLAKMAKNAGADGVICSPNEVQNLRGVTGDNFLYVTPGIRLSKNSNDDQVRVATPHNAKIWGSSAIVVGRPITQSQDPKAVYETIKKEFN